MRAWLLAVSLLAAPLGAAEPEPGVVEVAEAGPDQSQAWAALLAKKGAADWPAALEAWLKQNPHGPMAALALIEQAALLDDLAKAGGLLRLARGEGQGSAAGSAAALELARLEFAQERIESALAGLEEAEAWPRDEVLQPEWLFWKAQCRFVLKGYQRARDDFQHLAAGWPKHPRAPLALLGQAECDAALKEYGRAEPVFETLAKPGSSYAAQALWAWAGMKARQGEIEAARRLYARLKNGYPASFEAGSVDERLAALPKPQVAPKPTPRGPKRITVQVGAFSRKPTADKLAARLRKLKHPVLVQVKRFDGRSLYFVKTGPYKTRALAERAAQRIKAQIKEDPRIVEE